MNFRPFARKFRSQSSNREVAILQSRQMPETGTHLLDSKVGSCEAPSKDGPSTLCLQNQHVPRSQLLRTFWLQIIPLRKTGHFIEQKRNTNVCKNLLDVCEELERNPYTITDRQTSTLFRFRPDLCTAWVWLLPSGFRWGPTEQSRSNQANHLVNLPHVDAL